MLLHNAVAVCEAETRSGTRVFGRKKRIEDAPQHVRPHAMAIILDRDQHVVTGLELRRFVCRWASKGLTLRLNADLALSADGIARVEAQVEQYLLEL